MHTVSELRAIVSQTFREESFSFEPAGLYDPVSYALEAGGKRIRPFLALTGCDLYGGDLSQARPAMIAIELFHNFTLLHDDIMDQAPLRRGKETVYKKWNTSTAILSGDTMFAMACQQLASLPGDVLPSALALFAQTARQVCEGQQYDMEFETRDSVTIPEYLEMIRLKTAVLLGCSLRIGAMIARAPLSETETIGSFGENIGMAFQLNDDLLDVFGDEVKFGKATGGDILAGKKTFLLLKAFELATPELKNELNACFHGEPVAAKEKITRVKMVYETLDIRKITERKAELYYDAAMEEVSRLNLDETGRTFLRSFADELVRRDS